MTLDRDELAARLAEADWRNPRAEPLPLGEWGRTLVAYADDLIAALALTPPVAPKSEAAKPTHVKFTASLVDPDSPRRVLEWVDGKPVVGLHIGNQIDETRKSQPIDAGSWTVANPPKPPTPVSPSPEATRPTHVRYVGVLSSDKTLAREVLSWDAKGQPRVKYLSGDEVTLFADEWEPATPPAPVEPAKPGTVENMAAHLAWCAWCGTDGRSELPYDAFRAGYLAALAARGAP